MHNAKGGAPLLFRKRLADDEKKFIAFTHMMIVYVLLRWLNAKRLPSPQTTRLPSLFKFIPNLFSLYFPALVVEEFLHFFLLRYFVHIRNMNSFTIRGRPPPPESKDDDCCVCMGVGIGTHTTTFFTDIEEDEFADESCLGALENYCNIPHHVAHRPCMFRWFTTGLARVSGPILDFNQQLNQMRPAPVCPKCRGSLAVEIITKDSLVDDDNWRNRTTWNSRINSLIRDWRKVMNWRWIFARSELTIAYILIVWRILKWREKAQDKLLRR
ncbi:9160_t:CDS:2 [Ambispora leptoticha]|uniref:9160_t:CDS:1 n=1 Tax=Ambispora leptoticha TaxID=144679 RepID=A0A9N9AZR2_9GLOM|nr:9160_t:CDS:2 [Ambispora leptoticha]